MHTENNGIFIIENRLQRLRSSLRALYFEQRANLSNWTFPDLYLRLRRKISERPNPAQVTNCFHRHNFNSCNSLSVDSGYDINCR